jgi:hypothetical protein
MRPEISRHWNSPNSSTLDAAALERFQHRFRDRLAAALERPLPADGVTAANKFVAWTVNFTRLLRVTDPPITMFVPIVGEQFQSDLHRRVGNEPRAAAGDSITSVRFPGLYLGSAVLVLSEVTTLPVSAHLARVSYG